MLYERIDVYRRVSAQELVVYRCFRLTSGQGYVVQSADHLGVAAAESQHVAHEARLIELLLEEAPENRSPCLPTIAEAIQAFDKEFE